MLGLKWLVRVVKTKKKDLEDHIHLGTIRKWHVRIYQIQGKGWFLGKVHFQTKNYIRKFNFFWTKWWFFASADISSALYLPHAQILEFDRILIGFFQILSNYTIQPSCHLSNSFIHLFNCLFIQQTLSSCLWMRWMRHNPYPAESLQSRGAPIETHWQINRMML